MKDNKNKLKTNLMNIGGAIRTTEFWLARAKDMNLNPKTLMKIQTHNIRMKGAETPEQQARELKAFHKYLGIGKGGVRATKRLKRELVGIGDKGAYGVVLKPQEPQATGSLLTLVDIIDNWNFIRQQVAAFDVVTRQLTNVFNEYKDWTKRFLEAANLDGLDEALAFRVVTTFIDRYSELSALGEWMKKNRIDIELRGDIVGQMLTIERTMDNTPINNKMIILLGEIVTSIA